MGISIDLVLRIAKLARLRLTDGEAALYQGQLAAILAHVEDLGAADAPPVSQAPCLSNVFREDEPAPWPDREAILSNAPEREGDYIKVRKVL